MDKRKLKRKFFLLTIGILIFMFVVVRNPEMYRTILKQVQNQRPVPYFCPLWITDQTITPLKNTKHLLVSAFMDQRVKDVDIRIISIFRRDSIQPLQCLFCCSNWLSSTTTQAKIEEHSDNFGFPFVTTDVLCQIPPDCNATHVTLHPRPESEIASNRLWLPIRNQKTKEKEEKKLQFNFTVCISSLFGDYNNVLQFAQTLEMYR